MSSSPTKNSSLDSPLRRALEQPPLKRFRMASKTAEAGTITDPETLGACEPGTTINLDGIVWNETKGGMLSLNITWRGKSYMGTLIDCSVTDHGSEWAAPWSADTEAPDQRTRYLSRKKKNKKKKKKKKPADLNAAANVSNESIEEEKTEIKEELDKPLTMISCTKEGCEKKFTSESALKYHVTFAHERIKPIAAVRSCGDQNDSNVAVISDHKTKNDLQPANKDKNSSSLDLSHSKEQNSSSLDAGKTEKSSEKLKPKTFPSTQNIRPILPAQGPQIPGSLKPIQPKPAILPPPTKNLNLDTLKKPLSTQSACHKVNGSVSVKSEEQQATVGAIDLSGTALNGHIAAQLQDKKPSLTDLNHKILSSTSSSSPSPSIVTSASSPPKARTPIISVKSEFNTGNKQSLSDSFDKDELEVLKHISKPSSSVNATHLSSNPLHAELERAKALGQIGPTAGFPGLPAAPPGLPAGADPFLPGAFLGANQGSPHLGLPGLPPGFMLPPPSSTASHLLPGLMGLSGLPPPPTSMAALSPFGASLESLARAAEERSRSSFGSGAFTPSPGITPSPGASPAGSRGPGASVSGGGTPGTPSDKGPGDPPLLRHEHMHTHLHYITSPTHGQ